MGLSSHEFLVSLLEGSFDAGFLVDGATGTVIHGNKPAVDLFNAASEEALLINAENGSSTSSKAKKRLIGSLVSFWSYSLERHNKDDDDDSIDHSGRLNDDEAAGDTLPWAQVVKYASRVATEAAEDEDASDDGPVLEWTITGTKLAATGTRGLTPADEEAAAASAGGGVTSFEPKVKYEGDEVESSSVAAAAPTAKESFPGALKLTPVPDANLWLVYIRHADHHDIIHYGSVSQTGEMSGAGSRVKRSSRTGRSNKEPRMTINESGIIVDINDAALSSHLECWEWITNDLLGKHVSTVQIAATNANGSNSNSNNNNGKNKQKGGFKMLDMILESGMEPGHSACPMSGFPLRVDPDVSAMTTGGAQREENITEAAFEAALDPIFQIDEHGTIQMVNSSAIKTFGWSRREFLGSNISMICGGGHEPKHAGYMARYLATGDTRVIGKNRELIAKKKDGKEFPIELGVVEVDTFAGDLRLVCGFVRDLSNIKARELMAQEMVEAALDPMFQINQTGKILMVNNAALTSFGYDRDEMVGQNIRIICGGSHAHNHDLYLKRYIRTGETRVIGKYRELPAKRKDGTEFPIQLAVIEIEGSRHTEDRLFCGFVHNLSNQKRAQEIMRGTIDTSLDPVLHINENGIIQMVNNATVTHLGWTREELLGENVSLIVGSEHARHHGEYIERYLATGEKRAMGKKRALRARRKDGTEMPIELGLSEIKISGGKERMFCAFLTDLTHRQQSDE